MNTYKVYLKSQPTNPITLTGNVTVYNGVLIVDGQRAMEAAFGEGEWISIIKESEEEK